MALAGHSEMLKLQPALAGDKSTRETVDRGFALE